MSYGFELAAAVAGQNATRAEHVVRTLRAIARVLAVRDGSFAEAIWLAEQWADCVAYAEARRLRKGDNVRCVGVAEAALRGLAETLRMEDPDPTPVERSSPGVRRVNQVRDT